VSITRHNLLRGMKAAPSLALPGNPGFANAATNLEISHFPGGTLAQGDFGDRMCRHVAVDLEQRGNGAVKGTVRSGSSLMAAAVAASTSPRS